MYFGTPFAIQKGQINKYHIKVYNSLKVAILQLVFGINSNKKSGNFCIYDHSRLSHCNPYCFRLLHAVHCEKKERRKETVMN